MIFPALVCICLGCTQTPQTDKASDKTDTPGPLQDDKGSLADISSQRGGSVSMVDDIYRDIAAKQPDLKSLEDQLTMFNAEVPDSLAIFYRYSQKSAQYYSSAKLTVDAIQDTILKQRLKVMINQSQARYGQKTNKFDLLNKQLKNDEAIIADYHNMLKVVATLPVMQTYQDKNIPNIKPVTALSNKSTALKGKVIELTKKYELKASQ